MSYTVVTHHYTDASVSGKRAICTTHDEYAAAQATLDERSKTVGFQSGQILHSDTGEEAKHPAKAVAADPKVTPDKDDGADKPTAKAEPPKDSKTNGR